MAPNRNDRESGQAAASSGSTGQSGASQPAVSLWHGVIGSDDCGGSGGLVSGYRNGRESSRGHNSAVPALALLGARHLPRQGRLRGQEPAGNRASPRADRRQNTVSRQPSETPEQRPRGKPKPDSRHSRGWTPRKLGPALQLLKDLQSDPQSFFKELGERIKGLDGGAAEDEAYPEADLVNKDGTLKTYSHATHLKALDIHGRKVVAQVMKELKPFLSFTQSEQQRRQSERAEATRVQQIDEALKDVRTRKHFTPENEPAILEILQAIPAEDRKAKGPAWALNVAYNRFLEERVFPTLETDTDKRLRDEYQRKAAAGSGGVHPTGQGGDPKPQVIKGVDGLAKHMEQLAATAAGTR
jgi:hypothetical protein